MIDTDDEASGDGPGAPPVVWQPPPAGAQSTRVGQFLRWLERERGLSFDEYDDLWRWSVDALEDFWDAVWQFFGVPASACYSSVLSSRVMPGGRGFEGARLNYAAVWTSCAPDFGLRSVLDRLGQVEPTVLIAMDGYRWGGREHDRRDMVAQLREAMPSVRAVIVVQSLYPTDPLPDPHGSPAHPSLDALWQVAVETRASVFGMGSGYAAACAKAGLALPPDVRAHLRTVIPTGSPYPRPAGGGSATS